jgi:hypothetical protein
MSILDAPPAWRYWYGRKLFLAEKQNFFRCGGFAVNRVNPVSFVSENTQVNKIIEAVEAGVLIDITDNKGGLVIRGIGHGAAKVENTGKKIYITTDKNGGLAIKSAETPEEIAACEAQIKKTGIIVPQEYKFADPLDTAGRVQGADVALVLHNLEEKVENANQKIFGNLPKITPGPHKVT